MERHRDTERPRGQKQTHRDTHTQRGREMERHMQRQKGRYTEDSGTPGRAEYQVGEGRGAGRKEGEKEIHPGKSGSSAAAAGKSFCQKMVI